MKQHLAIPDLVPALLQLAAQQGNHVVDRDGNFTQRAIQSGKFDCSRSLIVFNGALCLPDSVE
jgi:tRNA U34 5-carboxymethylaminomethyl modifying GTPase MnmE/TrmE